MMRCLVVILALLLAACQRESADAPLALTAKRFVFNYRLAYATYLLTLEKVAAVPEGAYVQAQFENPAGGTPLVLERKLFSTQQRVVLESPDVTCVKKDTPYRVSVTLLAPGGETLQRLETTVTSSLDQSALPAKPLVVGPGYDPNPEVFKDGKAPARFEMMKCAK